MGVDGWQHEIFMGVPRRDVEPVGSRFCSFVRSFMIFTKGARCHREPLISKSNVSIYVYSFPSFASTATLAPDMLPELHGDMESLGFSVIMQEVCLFAAKFHRHACGGAAAALSAFRL